MRLLTSCGRRDFLGRFFRSHRVQSQKITPFFFPYGALQGGGDLAHVGRGGVAAEIGQYNWAEGDIAHARYHHFKDARSARLQWLLRSISRQSRLRSIIQSELARYGKQDTVLLDFAIHSKRFRAPVFMAPPWLQMPLLRQGLQQRRALGADLRKRMTNIPSLLKSCAKAGFRPYMLRSGNRRVFRFGYHQSFRAPFDAPTRYPISKKKAHGPRKKTDGTAPLMAAAAFKITGGFVGCSAVKRPHERAPRGAVRRKGKLGCQQWAAGDVCQRSSRSFRPRAAKV